MHICSLSNWGTYFMEIVRSDESKASEPSVQPEMKAAPRAQGTRHATATLAVRSPAEYARKMRRRKAHRAKLRRPHTKG